MFDLSTVVAILPWYLLTVAIEAPVLILGLSGRHSLTRRLFAGFWLTACTYPVVNMVLPVVFNAQADRALYVVVAEIFAPVAECALFWLAFGAKAEVGKRSMWRDFAAIAVANLISFGVGEALKTAHLI